MNGTNNTNRLSANGKKSNKKYRILCIDINSWLIFYLADDPIARGQAVSSRRSNFCDSVS